MQTPVIFERMRRTSQWVLTFIYDCVYVYYRLISTIIDIAKDINIFIPHLQDPDCNE